MEKAGKDFYMKSALELARALLGCLLIHRTEDGICAGKIVETEAYMGTKDKASHSYNNRRTKRTETMFGPSGQAYVYLIYGMYHCMNIVAAEPDNPQAVLIRALEPIDGLDLMAYRRYSKSLSDCSRKELLNLTNGPGKLCQAMKITIKNNGESLTGNSLYIVKQGTPKASDIITTTRINIAYAEEAVHFPYRFYIKNSPYVSVRDKAEELKAGR
jgi:DNA-3-methyladenine glycosylase